MAAAGLSDVRGEGRALVIDSHSPGFDFFRLSFESLRDAVVNYLPLDILNTDPGGTSILSGLDPSTLLSDLDLGNLGGLLDPSTLAGDLTTLLPSLASDLPAGLADLGTLIPF